MGIHIRMAPDLTVCKMMLTVNSFGYCLTVCVSLHSTSDIIRKGVSVL